MAFQYHEDFDGPFGMPRGGNATVSASGNGGNGLQLGDDFGTSATFTVPDPKGTIIIGMHCKWNDAGGGDANAPRFNDSSGRSCEFRYTEPGTVRVLNASQNQVASFSVTDQGWHTCEVKITHGNSGNITVRLDGVEVVNVAADTSSGGTAVESVLCGGSSAGDIDQFILDSIWIIDTTGTKNNDWLGWVTAEWLLPDGNGNSSDFVGSDGNSTDNYLLVNDDPINTAEYVDGSVEGDIDLYTHGNTGGDEDIVAVSVTAYTSLPNGGSRFLRDKTRISSTDYNGTSVAVAAGAAIQFFMDDDPNAAAAWTSTVVDGAEFGVEVRDT